MPERPHDHAARHARTEGGRQDARERAVLGFRSRFGSEPALLARAPGRVNLIGEHTDYNDGFVLPMALDRSAWLALKPRSDGRVRLVAADLEDEGEFTLAELDTASAPARSAEHRSSWLDYPRGVAWSLLEDGHKLQGFDGVLASDVPRGAGLSSSAALELAVAAAFLAGSSLAAGNGDFQRDLLGPNWDARRIALAMQRTENAWIGVNSGIMDQLIGAAAVAGHALLIDCRDLSLTPVPLPPGIAVAVLDTGTRRGLVGSAYNDRRASCDRVAAALGVSALRDVDLHDLERAAGLDPVDRRRARHVIEENRRTVEAAEALASDRVSRAGELMRQSHASLRDLFEVSSAALDAMVAAAEAAPGCLGARMTGAGFGGCAVALVARDELAAFKTATQHGYRRSTGEDAVIYASAAGAGAMATALS